MAQTTDASRRAGPADLGAGEPAADFGAWWMVAVLLAVYILSIVDRTMIALLVDPIKHRLGISDFQMSLILGPAFGVAYSLFNLPSGWAADRWQRRWVIFGGIFLWALMTILCGFATTFIALFMARMLVAIGEASLTPSAFSLITDRFPRRRLTSAISAYMMGPKSGASLAFILGGVAVGVATMLISRGGALLQGFEPWQLVFFMVGAPGLVMAFLVFTFPEPARRSGPKPVTTDTGTLSAFGFLKEQRKVFIPLFLGFGFVAIAAGALPAWLPTFMAREYGWTPQQYGPALGLVSALSALMLVPKGIAVDWLYARGIRDAPLRFFTWLLIAFTPVAAIIFVLPNPILFLIGFGFIQVVAIPFTVWASATIQLISPSRLRGRMTGLFLFIVPMFSQSLGPTLVAAISDFVLKDPQKLGIALAIVTAASMAASAITLRYTLRVIAPLLASSEEPGAAEAKTT